MQVGGAGSQAAAQLMQSTSTIKAMAAQQMKAVNNEVQGVKNSALENTASQLSSAVDRKGTVIDLMA